jgi:hypothetical protein
LNALGFGFGNQNDLLKLSRIFEDIGVTAYAGAAGLLSTPSIITTAARILAAEAEHVSTVRTQIARLNIETAALDGADLVPPPTGPTTQYLSINASNGLAATRTPGTCPLSCLWRPGRRLAGRLLSRRRQWRYYDELDASHRLKPCHIDSFNHNRR